jgi:ribosomal protein L11 methyltransferase
MAFLALRFDAGGADAEAWSDALLETGALSVDVGDPRAGTAAELPLYAEPGEPAGALWAVARLTALFPAGADAADAIASVARRLGCAVPAHQSYPVAEQDWVRATQAQFAPIRIAEDLWIVPSWCEAPDPDAVNVALDPGLAFGTGSHPTTRLCLAWLAAQLRRGASVLDYGCGSGILAIAAAKLGAGTVVGVDVDPQAIAASRANALANGVAATFGLAGERAAKATPPFDVVVANILAGPLVMLAPVLAARVKPGGRIVLSGVLDAQAADVGAVYARWFNIARWRCDGDWVALAGERRATRTGRRRPGLAPPAGS